MHALQESVGGAHLHFLGIEPVGGEPLMSVCDVWPVRRQTPVIFPATKKAGTKLYCLVTEAHVC